jgi:hypothetical protein
MGHKGSQGLRNFIMPRPLKSSLAKAARYCVEWNKGNSEAQNLALTTLMLDLSRHLSAVSVKVCTDKMLAASCLDDIAGGVKEVARLLRSM